MHFFSQDWNKPFQKFFEDDFLENFDQYFSGMGQQPRANVYESGNELICLINLPGIKKVDDIALNVYDSLLEVSGHSTLDYTGYRAIQEELYQGPFKKAIKLPFPVRKDKIDAFYKRGLLTIHLYRLIPNHTKEITIRDDE